MRMKRSLWLPVALIFLFFVGGITAKAEKMTYTVDYPQLTPPDFSSFTTQKSVSTLTELAKAVYDSSVTNTEIMLQNDITMTGEILVNGDLVINLNGHTINGGSSGYFRMASGTTTRNIKFTNGTMTSSRNSGGNIGYANNYSTGFITAETNGNQGYNSTNTPWINVVFENLTYRGSNTTGFYKGLKSDVFVLGDVSVNTGTYNIRSNNMTFLGNFTGNSSYQYNPGEYGMGYGGLNLSFDGQNRNASKSTIDSNNGSRRIYIGKNSTVNLNNSNSYSLPYANNIGNFASIVVEGKLDTTAVAAALRTTASQDSARNGYKSYAQTWNGQSNIYVLPGADFKIESTTTQAGYGALYTYNTNMYVDTPKVFDMRYYGTGNFFYAYPNSPTSNLYINSSNIGVWDKNAKGIGNPLKLWQNVDWLNLQNFTIYSASNVSSSNSSINSSTFTINNYSRISNDVSLPMIIPDSKFVNSNQDTFLNNGDTSFNGSTDYYLPNGEKTGQVAANATVTFKLDGKTYTTTTDNDGKWSFDKLDLSKVKGGTTGTIDLTDDDQRIAPQIKVTVKDTIPPVATPKLISVDLGDTKALQDPKTGVATYSDETTTAANMKFDFVTSTESRTNMINKLGVYNVDINVIDEAGNKTLVTAPVIVHPKGEKITDGFVVGNDFNIDYNTWLNASDDKKRNFLVDEAYGSVKGYAISGNTVTDVSSDTSKMVVTMPTSNWEPNKTYPISVKVNSYTKKINVTLIPSAVKMTIQQVYKGTDIPIYSNLETKLPVDNTSPYEETIGDNIATIINDKISSDVFTLNYEGYDSLAVSDYKIYQKGVEVTPTPTIVPNEDFTIVYEYEGQLKFKDVAKNLNFGSIMISGDSSVTPLSESSDGSLSIINTIQNASWKLKAAIPNGITQTDGKKQSFLGSVVYKDTSGTKQTIGQSPTTIETQKDNSLFSTVELKDTNTGMFLQQDAGNLQGSYTGKLVWTLEDTPVP